jgi:hypothetical protein
MDENTPEKAKAVRDLRLIVVVMVVGTVMPFAVYYLFHR